MTDSGREKPSASVVFIHTDHPSEGAINGGDVTDCFPFIHVGQPAIQQRKC